jgi:nucleotide-binding universal stress UspA family protein
MALPTCLVTGVDASPESVAALEVALELGTAIGARVIAVHAIGLLEEGGYRPRLDLAAILREAQRRVAAEASVELVQEDGVPQDVMLRVAEREGAELIVIGSRGLGGALRQLGSTSEALVSHSSVPVLVVPGTRDRVGSPASGPQSAGM